MGHLRIKDIPEPVDRELRRRAELDRMSMRDYVLRLIEIDQARPKVDEWSEELERDEPVELPESAAELVRRARDEREAELMARIRGNAGR